MITGLNESKKLTKHISRKYGCKFDCRECNKGSSEITINVGVSAKTQKKIMHAKKEYIWNPTTCTCENGNS